jgi:hypothetical protein
MKGGEGEMNMMLMMGDVEGTTADAQTTTTTAARGAAGKIVLHEIGVTATGSAGDPHGALRPHDARARSHSASASAPPAEDKTKPNFAPSGLLAAATNTVKNADGTSTLLKYNEPPEARKPLVGWRLYVFKGEEQLGAFCILLLLFSCSTVHSTCFFKMQSCFIYIVRARTSSVVTAQSQIYPLNIRRAPSSML